MVDNPLVGSIAAPGCRRALISHKSMKSLRRILNTSRHFLPVAWQDIRANHLGQIFPCYPTVVNLLVNDICNSKCQMCHIWGRKRDHELTPEELSRVLLDPLFRSVKYIGVSGGEPTLRKDLVELYRVIVNKQPRIDGTGIITNAIRSEDVVTKLRESFDVCRNAGIPFNVMISLDGIGHIHDKVRGRPGNFQSALNVIESLRHEIDLPLSIGCTVTKDNVWHVDEVLDWCRTEEIYGRFRVAEFIHRLYNDDQAAYIRNFSDDEAYHLGLFFSKLEYQYERSPKIRRTYRNIRTMLMENAPRSIKCPWQTNGVTLDCRGQLLYCAPRSPILGNCLKSPAKQLYLGNLVKRKEILRNDCDGCIHDYHADETISERVRLAKDERWHRKLSLRAAVKAARSAAGRRAGLPRDVPPGTFLIVGWYGTETAGDKAILAEIVHRIRERSRSPRILLASLFPYVTHRTVRELGIDEIEVIPSYSRDLWHWAEAADEVIMGGGPLMHLDQLGLVLMSFLRAKRAGARTVVAGCGVGPLDRGGDYPEAVQWILRLADVIELRDSRSVALAREMTGRTDITNTGDPAGDYVKRWQIQTSSRPPVRSDEPFLNLYLREWTTEYQAGESPAGFEDIKNNFETELAGWVRQVCKSHGLRPKLVPMHHFCIGNDDRDFNRRFSARLLADLNPVVEFRPVSLDEILTGMGQATLNICMRFHSILFAHELEVPYFAIDYTSGGKISGFLSDSDALDNMIDLREVANGGWKKLISGKSIPLRRSEH